MKRACFALCLLAALLLSAAGQTPPSTTAPASPPATTPAPASRPGPQVSFYAVHDTAKRVVFILDRSGSMLDNFSFLQDEVAKTIKGLTEDQAFAVIVFSDDAQILVKNQLLPASPENKRVAVKEMNAVVVRGVSDEFLDPFRDAFTKAFDLKPDVVYFLTDGHFDDRLGDEVAKLNKGQGVRIHTIAFVNARKDYQEQLQKLAKANGGQFKFVSEKDLVTRVPGAP